MDGNYSVHYVKASVFHTFHCYKAALFGHKTIVSKYRVTQEKWKYFFRYTGCFENFFKCFANVFF